MAVEDKLVTLASLKEVYGVVKLLSDDIPGTTQVYTFSGNNISSVVHRSGNTNIRTDTFVFNDGGIIETRVLSSGESMAISMDLDTLQTTVSYTYT